MITQEPPLFTPQLIVVISSLYCDHRLVTWPRGRGLDPNYKTSLNKNKNKSVKYKLIASFKDRDNVTG